MLLESLPQDERIKVISYVANGWGYALPTHLECIQISRLDAWEMILDECPSPSGVLLTNLTPESDPYHAKNAFVAWCINGGMRFSLYDEVEEVWKTDRVNPYYSLVTLNPPKQFKVECIRIPLPIFLAMLPATYKYQVDNARFDFDEMLSGVAVDIHGEVSITQLRRKLTELFGQHFITSKPA